MKVKVKIETIRQWLKEENSSLKIRKELLAAYSNQPPNPIFLKEIYGKIALLGRMDLLEELFKIPDFKLPEVRYHGVKEKTFRERIFHEFIKGEVNRYLKSSPEEKQDYLEIHSFRLKHAFEVIELIPIPLKGRYRFHPDIDYIVKNANEKTHFPLLQIIFEHYYKGNQDLSLRYHDLTCKDDSEYPYHLMTMGMRTLEQFDHAFNFAPIHKMVPEKASASSWLFFLSDLSQNIKSKDGLEGLESWFYQKIKKDVEANEKSISHWWSFWVSPSLLEGTFKKYVTKPDGVALALMNSLLKISEEKSIPYQQITIYQNSENIHMFKEAFDKIGSCPQPVINWIHQQEVRASLEKIKLAPDKVKNRL